MWKVERTTEHEYINEGIHPAVQHHHRCGGGPPPTEPDADGGQRRAEELFLEAEQEAPAEKGA